MPPTVRDIIHVLDKDGWKLVKQRGSHRQFKHDNKSGRVTVAGNLKNEIPPGTLRSILRQAGLSRGDLT
jgi:predicted RNA binding protein YcfA (HicA-like mRNA interferase family)